jgi:molecular chaperone DnaJ
MQVRLAAQGEVGPGGGPGDACTSSPRKQHDVFIRDGDDPCAPSRCRWSTPRLAPVTVGAIIDSPTELTIPPAPSRVR